MAEESQTEPVGTQYKFIDNFMGGVRKDLRTDALPDNAGLDVHNVTMREGLVEVDKGYSQFMSSIDGSPQLIFQINYPNGTSDMILVTTETVFERLAGQWVYSIGSDGTNIHKTTLTAAAASNATVINVAATTGMTVGGKIGIRYISGLYHDITNTTKSTNSVYRVSNEQVFNSGDSISITGYDLATWNVEQTVVSTTVASDATYTNVTTNLDSSGFANTTATNPRIERFGSTQQHRTTIAGYPITSITKGTTTTYVLAGKHTLSPGNVAPFTNILVSNCDVSGYNVEQVIVTDPPGVTVATDTTIVTTLDSSSFATADITGTLELYDSTRTSSAVNITVSCSTVNTDATVTGSTTTLKAGMEVSGTGIPTDTTILSITNATSFELSANATVTATNTLTFSTSNKTVVLDDALPGRALELAQVIVAFSLSGSVDYIPDHVVVPNWTLPITGSINATIAGAAVVTNYMEEPFIICKGAGGTTVRSMKNASGVLPNITVSPFTSGDSSLTSFRAKTVELFNGKLIFGRCYENGTNYNSRIRMSAAFDGITNSLYENFTSEDGGEVYDLAEGDSNIQSIRTLGKLLMVYKRNVIFRGDYTGGVDASTRFQSTIFNEGAISTHSVVKVPGKHYVVGTKNIYEYTGGLTLNNIGDPIREDLYTPDRFANVTMKEFIHCVYDPEMQEFQLFYPEGTIKGMRKAFRYSEQNQSWSSRTYTHYFNYGNNFTSTETLTWQQLTQPWENYNQPWVSAFFVTEKLHRFLLGQGKYVSSVGDVETGTAYVYDANSMATKDTLYSIPWQFDTKDFYLPNSFIRIDFLDLYAAGDDVTLWYSEDLGSVWTRVRSLEPKTVIERERVHLNKASKRMRFRLKGSSANFQLGWAGFSFTPEFSW